MRSVIFTKTKFLSLTCKQRHKHLARLLQECIAHPERFEKYQQLSLWEGLSSINYEQEELEDRYTYHMQKAYSHWSENHQLGFHLDRLSTPTPFLPLHIYIANLRSAANLGNILRTVEGFRLGSVYLSEKCPDPLQKKCLDSAMGTASLIPLQKNADLSQLPRPWIALEKTPHAHPLETFFFPEKFTLLLGNEAYGIAKSLLDLCDVVVSISMSGTKNSLNVASAFAIAAYHIHTQLQRKS